MSPLEKTSVGDANLPFFNVPNEPRRHRGGHGYIFLVVLTAFGIAWLGGCKLPTFTKDSRVASRVVLEDWRKLPTRTVRWAPCEGPGALKGSECGFIIVPMNYLKPDAEVAKVALGRYNATKTPRKGIVLFNFGGPGGPGASRVVNAPSYQATVIGEDYDWIGFDPRGIGETEPKTQCFPPGGYPSFGKNTVLELGFDVPNNLNDPRTRPHLLRQQNEANSLYETQFDVCKQSMGDVLNYMGTTIVSRDVEFITTTLEGRDAPINYYGYSYGTVLGQYIVNMFPDRVGRVVIDGVVDATAWAGQPYYKWYRDWLGYTDRTYDLFMSLCSKAGPVSCPLAKFINEPADIIKARLEGFFDKLYDKPMPAPYAQSPGILNNGVARSPLFVSLARPLTWPNISSALYSALSGNATDLMNSRIPLPDDLERSAVTCNDAMPFAPPDPAVVVDTALSTIRDVTKFGLTVLITEPDAGCQYWPGHPPERFTGPWNQTLENPILVHSNLLDPATPISSGRKVRKLLGDSARLAIRDGAGHCSPSLPSLCTVKVNRAFFSDGTLPPDEHFCGVDASPFPSLDNGAQIKEYTKEEQDWLRHLHIIAKDIYM